MEDLDFGLREVRKGRTGELGDGFRGGERGVEVSGEVGVLPGPFELRALGSAEGEGREGEHTWRAWSLVGKP